MKLTYRGIDYKSSKAAIELKHYEKGIPTAKYRLSNHQDSNKVIVIKPIHYFTYRGVSYTKQLIFDTQTKFLLDIDRQ